MKDWLLTRREFGKMTAGIVVTLPLVPDLAWSAEPELPGDLGKAPMLDSWLLIDPDGNVTIFTGKVELGQGILTALTQIAAEELGVPFSDFRIISGDTERAPDEQYTTGSQSVEKSGAAIRFACAEARSVLIKRASTLLGVPASKLKVAKGTVISPSGTKISYGELAKGGILHRSATARVQPKAAKNHTVVGKPAGRMDIPAKATGSSVYVQDLRLPGMVFGRIVRPPGPRDLLVDVDIAAVNRMPGCSRWCGMAVFSAWLRTVKNKQLGPGRRCARVRSGIPKRIFRSPIGFLFGCKISQMKIGWWTKSNPRQISTWFKELTQPIPSPMGPTVRLGLPAPWLR